ncbi:MAG: tetratricopeptide repeat protein [Syntrophothermus sp.]
MRGRISEAFLYMFLFFFISIPVSAQISRQEDRTDLLLYRGKYKEALALLEPALKADSLSAQLFYKTGLAYQGLYQTGRAHNYFLKAHLLDTSNTEFLLSLGRSYSNNGFNREALESYRIAYEKDSLNINTALTYASAMMSNTMYSKASLIFEKLLQQDSLSSYLWSQLAFCSLRLDSLNTALGLYKKALSFDSTDINLMQQLAVLYIKFNKTEPANELVDRGMMLYTNNPAFPKLKGEILYKEKKYWDAVKYYEKSIDLGEQGAYVLQKMGMCCYLYAAENNSIPYNKKVEYFKKAKDALQKGYDKDNTNPFFNFYLGIMYARIGDFDQAIKLFDITLGMCIPEFTSEIYNYLGDSYRVKKKYREAVDAYKMCLMLNPENIRVIDNVYTVYTASLKDKDGMETYFREFLNYNSEISDAAKLTVTDRVQFSKEKK